MGSRREMILQKINPKLLKMTPKLSGDAGSVIDLDLDDPLEDGAKRLMMRFFRNQDLCERNKRNLAKEIPELTISSAKYNENNEICELISERLTLPFARNDEDNINKKPGGRLQKLKMELQEKMSAKWEEGYKKRVSENKLYSKSKPKHKKTHSNYESDNSGEEETFEEEEEEEDDEEETTEVAKEVEKDEDDASNGFGDFEDSDSDMVSTAADIQTKIDSEPIEESNQDKEYDYDDGDGCSLVPAYQPGGGMLYGGSELTQTEEGLPQNLLSPSLRLIIYESGDSKISEFQSFNDGTPRKIKGTACEEAHISIMEKTKVFSEFPNETFDLNDAFEFCSGKFPDAEEHSGSSSENQNNIEYNCKDTDDVDGCNLKSLSEAEELDESSPLEMEKKTLKSRKILAAFEDSEEEEEEEAEKPKDNDIESGETEETNSAPWKFLSDDDDDGGGEEEKSKGGDKIKSKKKRRQTLYFSDEEDVTNNVEPIRKDDDDDSDEADNSEEEEEDLDDCEKRSVHYDSEENEIINPKEFFEKEAELSGSEYSGDEDERGLDEFDVEEGDADKLDDDLVRSQLEKIHIRRVLDDDAREVRLIQEILFEDGDLHSDGKRRNRKFRWKNLGTFEEGNEGELKEEGGNSSEDEGAEEEKLRKLRYEKELFLMTKKKTVDLSSDDEIAEDLNSIKVTSVKTSIKPSGNGENTVGSSKAVFDCTKIGAAMNFCKNGRGSFLTRNEEFLSKLAKATSGITENVLGPKSSKNFVFATKSPEKKNPEGNTGCKRQVEHSESCSRREKKLKLLAPEIDTGPSILDLLA